MSFRIPADTQQLLEEVSKETGREKSDLIREMLETGLAEKRLERSIRLYEKGKITLWKAARRAGVSLWKMTEVLKERRVEVRYGPEELNEDLEALGE